MLLTKPSFREASYIEAVYNDNKHRLFLSCEVLEHVENNLQQYYQYNRVQNAVIVICQLRVWTPSNAFALSLSMNVTLIA